MSRTAHLLRRLLDRAFGHPRGRLGRLGGALMARGNAEQESWAVGMATLHPGETVLVVGHGPGIGLALAAEGVAPSGRVIGVDPSETMRRLAAERCPERIRSGLVVLRAGTAEHTGCEDGVIDSAISVNNVMLWDVPAGFREMARVLRPGGRLVVSVHRHLLGVPPESLRDHAEAAGFSRVQLRVRPRRGNSPAVELLAARGGG